MGASSSTIARFYGGGTNTYAMMLRFGNLAATVAWFGLTFGFIALELLDLTHLLGYHGSKSAVKIEGMGK